MPTVHTAQGHSFSAQDGETILAAAARQGVQFPYSCRTGRCSSCKCQVVDGDTRALQDELGLSTEDQDNGWILSCVRTACTDVSLKVPDLLDVPLPAAKTLPCRIDALTRVQDDVLLVSLRLPPTQDFSFLPGQYIEVIGPEGQRRSYSLACAQAQEYRLSLHVRRVPEGFLSRYWFEQAQVNDLLRIHGPLGTFVLRQGAQRDWLFLATGTGIAPVKAMLESMATLPPEQQPRSVTLYWGARTAADFYWTPDFPALPLRYVPVLSRADERWSGARGHVQDQACLDFPDLSQAMVYACGSDAMIRSAHQRLQAQGLPQNRFHSDAFVASAPT